MKRLLLSLALLIAVFTAGTATAQNNVPGTINYQALVRYADNHIAANTQIDIQLLVVRNFESKFSENARVVTNAQGIFSYNFGSSPLSAQSLRDIDWSLGGYKFVFQFKFDGDANYTVISEQEFSTLAYAFYADNAGHLIGLNDTITVLRNELKQVKTELTDSINNVSYNLDDEITRATAAELALSVRVISDSSRLEVETLRAKRVEADNAKGIVDSAANVRAGIVAETLRANNAEQALGARIDTTSTGIRADLNAEITRADNAEQALGVRIDTTSTGIRTDLNSEISRANNAEQALGVRIDTTSSQIRTDLNAEISRANNAEQALGVRIDTTSTGIRADLNAEISRANNAEQALGVRIDTTSSQIRTDLNYEVFRATTVENALGVRIDTTSSQIRTDLNYETFRATTVENALGVRIDTTSSQIRTDLNAETSRANIAEQALGVRIDTTSSQIRTDLNAETSRANNAEQALGVRIDTTSSQIRADLNSETARALAAEQVINNNIIKENQRADSVENAIKVDISNEVARATRIEDSLSTNIDNETIRAKAEELFLTTNLNNEVVRASKADSVLNAGINAEIARANNVEAAISGRIIADSLALNAEATRAQVAENGITDNLNAEIARANGAENNLSARIAADSLRGVIDTTAIYARIAAERNESILGDSAIYNTVIPHCNEVYRATQQVAAAEAQQDSLVADLKTKFQDFETADKSIHARLGKNNTNTAAVINTEIARAQGVEDSIAAVVTANAPVPAQLVDSLGAVDNANIDNLTDDLHNNYIDNTTALDEFAALNHDTANVVRAEIAVAVAAANARVDNTNARLVDVKAITMAEDSVIAAGIDSLAGVDTVHYNAYEAFLNGQFAQFDTNIHKEFATMDNAIRDSIRKLAAPIYDSVPKLDEKYDTITVRNVYRVSDAEYQVATLQTRYEQHNNLAAVLSNGYDADAVAIQNLGAPVDDNDAARIAELNALRDSIMALLAPIQESINSISTTAATSREEMNVLNTYRDTNVYFAAGKSTTVRSKVLDQVDATYYDTIPNEAGDNALYTILVMHTFDAATILTGNGLESASPFEIATVEDLDIFRDICASDYAGTKPIYAKVVADINVDVPFMPIAAKKAFKGVFDGNGKTITFSKGFVNDSSFFRYGLFSNITYIPTTLQSEIKDLTIKGGADIKYTGSSASFAFGPFVANATGVKLTNCVNAMDSIAVSSDVAKFVKVGGIAGTLTGTTAVQSQVNKCSFGLDSKIVVNATQSAYVGGIASDITYTEISGNDVHGSYDITANGAYFAGIATVAKTSTIADNYVYIKGLTVNASKVTKACLSTSNLSDISGNFIQITGYTPEYVHGTVTTAYTDAAFVGTVSSTSAKFYSTAAKADEQTKFKSFTTPQGYLNTALSVTYWKYNSTAKSVFISRN